MLGKLFKLTKKIFKILFYEKALTKEKLEIPPEVQEDPVGTPNA